MSSDSITPDAAPPGPPGDRGGLALVTGGAGFIGSHLVEALLRRGTAVRALARYTSRSDTGWLAGLDPALADGLEIVQGDVRDADAMQAAARGADTIFHLAASISIPYSYRNPREVVETNLGGTLNVLQAALAGGAGRVVHTSTSEVYGTAIEVPISERHPLQAQSPYAASKIAADKLVQSFHLSFGLPTVTVRPFNTYGPRQSPRAVIAAIIQQALSSDRIRLGALTPTRDFTFVEDTVRGFLAAAESEAALGREINLGTGREISIGDLAAVILDRVGRALPIECEDRRLRPADSEVGRLLSDNRLARELLGWAPTVSLEEGLDRTIAWARERADLSHAEEYAV